MNSQESLIFEERPLIYASFWERFGAAFIDGLILLVPNLIITFAFRNGGSGSALGSLLNIAISWLYAALQESGPHQATFGKRAMRIKVVNEAGGRIGFGQATGRHFGKLVSSLILCIGYLMMLWDDRKQTLHDKMAGTFVVAAN